MRSSTDGPRQARSDLHKNDRITKDSDARITGVKRPTIPLVPHLRSRAASQTNTTDRNAKETGRTTKIIRDVVSSDVNVAFRRGRRRGVNPAAERAAFRRGDGRERAVPRARSSAPGERDEFQSLDSPITSNCGEYPLPLQDARYVIKSVICDPNFERLVLGCIEADFCK